MVGFGFLGFPRLFPMMLYTNECSAQLQHLQFVTTTVLTWVVRVKVVERKEMREASKPYRRGVACLSDQYSGDRSTSRASS